MSREKNNILFDFDIIKYFIIKVSPIADIIKNIVI